MATDIRPTFMAEGVEEPFKVPAEVLRLRIEDDPAAAQIALRALRQSPQLKPIDDRELRRKTTDKVAEAATSYRTIILSGLYRYFSFDGQTAAALENDADYEHLLAGRRRHPEWGKQDLEDNRVQIGATELCHYAASVLAAQATRSAAETAEPVQLPAILEHIDNAS